MRLDVLGSSGTYPTADRPASGYLISDEATHVLCDAGFGTFAELTRRMRGRLTWAIPREPRT